MRTVTEKNLVLHTDSYKIGHHFQYPPGMTYMQDYLESRGGFHPGTIFFGLQYILLRYLSKRVTMEDVQEAHELLAQHFGTDEFFPFDGWKRVVRRWGGRIPIRIRAVPEGGYYPIHTPLIRVESLDPELLWMVSWFEGLLQKVWYPTTVATLDFFTKIDMLSALETSSDRPMDDINFMLHDFGYRGVSSEESAEIGGAAALVNFRGTDTLPALELLRDYYGAKGAVGFSIAAMEHSTVTTWTRAGEVEAFRNMLRRTNKYPLRAIVIDSYDAYNAVSNIIGEQLRTEVENINGVLVVRPDSGDPVAIVSDIAYRLDQKFGSTVNSKGYKVLNKVKIIQGDGINHNGVISEIIDRLMLGGYSAANVAFGMGGGRLQDMTRDTQKFAIKCSLGIVDGGLREVYKDPITDPGKESLRGGVDTIDGFFEPQAVSGLGTEPDPRSIMRTVYETGDVPVEDTIDAIRDRADRAFDRWTGNTTL
jgi:nicotinamide phosphoribosyltransferase